MTELNASGAAEPISDDRWFLSDVDGRMEIWREAVLLDVTRDENGEIDSYRTPVSWAPGDLILYRDLETWNEGEDAADDVRRRVAAQMVSDHNEVERLRAAERRVRELAAEFRESEKDLLERHDKATDDARATALLSAAALTGNAANRIERAVDGTEAGR